MDPLVTAEDLAAYLQREGMDRATADLALAGASGLVREYCRWTIAPTEEVTWTVDGSGTTILSLPTMHLTAVTAVRLDGVALVEAPAGISTGAEYTWSGGGQLRRTAGWPARHRCVEVDAVHCWDTTPDQVRAVVLSLAARSMDNPDRLVSKTVGGVSRTWGTPAPDMSALELRMISGFRLP